MLRNWCLNRHWLAFALVVSALAVRMLVPQGFMPVASGHVLTVEICADASGLDHVQNILVPDRPTSHPDGQDHHTPCPFAAHAMPLLGGADAVLLLAALLFVMVLALSRATGGSPARPARLLPPLRAPPAFS